MIDLRYWFIGLAIAGMVAWLLTWLFGLPFIAAFLLTAGAMFLNGLVADWEDRRPGGFYNPRDKDKE